MQTIVVGDLHGKIEIAKKVLSLINKHNYNVVFVGDYLDSYDRSDADHHNLLDLLLETTEKEPNKVKCLLGNHELSYINPWMRCSSYNPSTQYKVNEVLEKMLELFHSFIWVEGFLISHAGVSKKLVKNKAELASYLAKKDFNQIGYARGGRHTCGGLYWCDWWAEFISIENSPQIVGHSHYRPSGYKPGIVTKGSPQEGSLSYNIDCLNRVNEVLLIKGYREAEIINLDTFL